MRLLLKSGNSIFKKHIANLSLVLIFFQKIFWKCLQLIVLITNYNPWSIIKNMYIYILFLSKLASWPRNFLSCDEEKSFQWNLTISFSSLLLCYTRPPDERLGWNIFFHLHILEDLIHLPPMHIHYLLKLIIHLKH